MRGPSKSLPKYRKHKRSGQAIVTLSGKDFYLGPHGTNASKLEYDRLIGEWLANGRQLPSQNRDEGEYKVAQLCLAYWQHTKDYYVKNGRPTDEQACIKTALRDTRALYGRHTVSEFGPLALEAVRNSMIARDCSRKYINSQVNRIRRMFKWGVARELVPASVFQALRAVDGLKKGKSKARETGPVLPVSSEVVDQTLQHLRNPVSADMIRVQRLTGCRPGELFIMRPVDIDRTGGGHDGVWLYWPESHKMEHKDRHRVIVIGPKAQLVLAKYLLKDEQELCFTRSRNLPYQRWHYAQHINTACDRAFSAPQDLDEAGKKAWRKKHRWAPNRLRHSMATEVRKTFGLEAAQVVAGHANADITQVYAERDLDKAAKAIAAVG